MESGIYIYIFCLKINIGFENCNSNSILLLLRIFPGQDPTHVYVGWVTTQYHYYSKEFNQTKVRNSSVYIVDDYDRILDR